MKTLDKKHRLAYQDVFLYTRITSRIVETSFSADVSSPFLYKDGDKFEIYMDDDVITGIGQRNFQRDRLQNSRGKVILFRGDNSKHREKIAGKWNRNKNVVTLYPTERLLPEEIKMLNLINKHLTENDVTVIIDIDEKHRYRNEMRKKHGDRVQHRNMPSTYHGNSPEDDWDDDED